VESRIGDENMVLKAGDKVLVAHRRLFDGDESRFFVGRVDAYEAGVVRVTGHSFVRDRVVGRLIAKAGDRTKLLSLSSGTLIAYQLPDSTSLDTVQFVSEGLRLWLTDGNGLTMDLAEFTFGGRGGPHPPHGGPVHATAEPGAALPQAGRPTEAPRPESAGGRGGVVRLVALALALAGIACLAAVLVGALGESAGDTGEPLPPIMDRIMAARGWVAAGAALLAAAVILCWLAPGRRGQGAA
jgi:hypothetical protein